MSSVHSGMGCAPRCLVSHCESFVSVVMVSLQYVKKTQTKPHLNTWNKNNLFSGAGFGIPPEDHVAKL